MGLLTQYQDEAERLARQDKNLMRNYSHDVRGLKNEAAPHESVVKDYNTQVDGFKNSAVHYNKHNASEDKVDSVLWQIVGHFTTGLSEAPGKVVATPTDQAGRSTYTGDQIYDAAGLYRASFAGQPNGGYAWGSQNGKTLRNASGVAVESMPDDNSSIYGRQPEAFYASWNDRPFVAPLTQSQIDTAKTADSALSEIGDRGKVMRGEFDASQGLLSKKADRLEGDVAMNKGALAADMQPEAGGSVFDQTKVFQSITDWLKG